MRMNCVTAVVAAGLLTCSGYAESTSVPDDVVSRLEAKIAELRSELDQVKAETQQDWITEARAEEIRTLVHDVLADADTRASLLQSGATAGYDGGFFIRSGDGKYLLKLNGQLQVRYIWNNRDGGGSSIDEDQFGFQVRRAKLQGKGHIGDPKIGYTFSLAGDRDESGKDDDGDPEDFGGVIVEDYYLNYTFDNGWMVQAGRWKQPFARENIMSSSRQMAVERGLVLEMFNVDRSEGIMAQYKGDNIQFAASFNDGIDAQGSDFDTGNNMVDYGITARFDYMAMGEWDQMKDYASWSGEPQALFLGAAVHYQLGESDTPRLDDTSVLLLTGDVLYENDGLSLSGAVYYSDIDLDVMDFQHWGAQAQIAYNIDDEFEPFFRYEFIALDDAVPGLVDDEINLITLGLNWYQKKHNAKFTVDVVFVLDHIDDDAASYTMLDPSTGLGLLDDTGDEDGQFAFRAQYQLAF